MRKIRMSGGEFHRENGAARRLEGSFRYSEKAGKPDVRYSVAAAHGRLTVAVPPGISAGSQPVVVSIGGATSKTSNLTIQ